MANLTSSSSPTKSKSKTALSTRGMTPTGKDIWYGAMNDSEKGKLSILMESVVNHELGYQSGMLQSGNKFCFTGVDRG